MRDFGLVQTDTTEAVDEKKRHVSSEGQIWKAGCDTQGESLRRKWRRREKSGNMEQN
jgi:hypothetical protein